MELIGSPGAADGLKAAQEITSSVGGGGGLVFGVINAALTPVLRILSEFLGFLTARPFN